MDIGLEGLEARLEAAIFAANMAWWEMELPSGVIFFHENKTKMLGYKSENFVHYKNFTDLIHPDDYEGAMEAMRKHMRGEVDYYHTIYRIKDSQGNYQTFFDRGKIVAHDDKGSFKIAGVVVNIADQASELADFMNKAKM